MARNLYLQANINGPKLFLESTWSLLCDKRKRRNARKSCTGLQPNYNLKFSSQRYMHVLASPSRGSYHLSFLDKFKLSCHTALLTFGEVCLTTFSHSFRSLRSSLRITKQSSELQVDIFSRQRTASSMRNS